MGPWCRSHRKVCYTNFFRSDLPNAAGTDILADRAVCSEALISLSIKWGRERC